MEEDAKRRAKIYGINFITPSVANFLRNAPKLSEAINEIPHLSGGLEKVAGSANPYGGLAFGALGALKGMSDKIKESKYTRLAEFGGGTFYGILAIADLFSIAGGEYQSIVDLAFNASMAYSLGKDTAQNYENNDLVDDLTQW